VHNCLCCNGTPPGCHNCMRHMLRLPCSSTLLALQVPHKCWHYKCRIRRGVRATCGAMHHQQLIDDTGVPPCTGCRAAALPQPRPTCCLEPHRQGSNGLVVPRILSPMALAHEPGAPEARIGPRVCTLCASCSHWLAAGQIECGESAARGGLPLLHLSVHVQCVRHIAATAGQ